MYAVYRSVLYCLRSDIIAGGNGNNNIREGLFSYKSDLRMEAIETLIAQKIRNFEML
jgi:hypothetical protein